MEKYIVSNIEFDSRKEIKQKIQDIEKSYSDYVPVSGNDLVFMLDVFRNHYNFENKIRGMTDIYFAPHHEYKSTRCVHIAYGNKNTDIKNRPSDDISWTVCLKRIKRVKPKLNGSIITFGKYKGKTVEEVCEMDRSYLEWILRTFKEEEIKNEVKKHTITKENKKMNNTTQSTMNLFYTNRKTHTTPIAQYDLSGNLLRIYNSGKETAQHGYNPQCVSKCVNNKLKLHNKSIFIKISNKNKAEPKIDPKPYIIQDNKTNSNKNEFVKETITIKPKGLRIGMFNKQKELLQVFTKIQQIENKFGHTSGVFDHLYGKIKTKNKIKNGYNNLYFFRKLDVGQTYTIGEKYDLRKFEKAVPRKITSGPNKNVTTVKEKITPENKTIPVEYKNINTETIPTKNKTIPVENKTITIEELKNIFPQPEPKKRNFIQRFMYLFTGK
jgi:hypothetical protein